MGIYRYDVVLAVLLHQIPHVRALGKFRFLESQSWRHLHREVPIIRGYNTYKLLLNHILRDLARSES